MLTQTFTSTARLNCWSEPAAVTLAEWQQKTVCDTLHTEARFVPDSVKGAGTSLMIIEFKKKLTPGGTTYAWIL